MFGSYSIRDKIMLTHYQVYVFFRIKKCYNIITDIFDIIIKNI